MVFTPRLLSITWSVLHCENFILIVWDREISKIINIVLHRIVLHYELGTKHEEVGAAYERSEKK